MGWGGGTEIFDLVADELLDIYQNSYDTDIPMYKILNLLSSVNGKLNEMDWDTQNESRYYNHRKIGEILGNDNIEE